MTRFWWFDVCVPDPSFDVDPAAMRQQDLWWWFWRLKYNLYQGPATFLGECGDGRSSRRSASRRRGLNLEESAGLDLVTGFCEANFWCTWNNEPQCAPQRLSRGCFQNREHKDKTKSPGKTVDGQLNSTPGAWSKFSRATELQCYCFASPCHSSRFDLVRPLAWQPCCEAAKIIKIGRTGFKIQSQA